MAYTANGAKTLSTSGNQAVDLFASIGSARNNMDAVVDLFNRVYEQCPKTALRILLWTRDIRGGAGEREIFRKCIKEAAQTQSGAQRVLAIINAGKVEELGRWDDLLTLIDVPEVSQAVVAHIKSALDEGNSLCAKWMPRKGEVAAKLRRQLGLTPKKYRKLLVGLTNVVETLMCRNDWNSIDFTKITSLNLSRYGSAFARNAKERWTAYKTSAQEGKVKVKAAALFPYDVVRNIRYGDQSMAQLQWDAMENTIEGAEGILPIIDVSGSMECRISGRLTAMDIAIALGIYCAQRQTGAFKNLAITFESKPSVFDVTAEGSDIISMVNYVKKQPWGGSTNYQAVFDLILKAAKERNLDPFDMPKYVITISDMEFNEANGYNDDINFNVIKEKFKAAGYEMPSMIFWNVNARVGNQPAAAYENVALISGFSPNILKRVFANKSMTAEEVMWETIGNSRYDVEGATI